MKLVPSPFPVYFGKSAEQQKAETAQFTMNQFALQQSSFVKGPTISFNIHALPD